MSDRGFLIFWFFCYFFRNFLARVKYERNSGQKFFLAFSAYDLPKNIAGKRFFNFLNFFTIFFKILFPGLSMNGIRDKFFCLLLGHSQPIFDRNNAGINIFNFFDFFCFFFRNFLAQVEYEQNSGLKFFSLFVGLSQPDLDINNAEINFSNFFAFFLEFSGTGCLGTEFGTKIFFPLCRPISYRFG